MLLVARRASLVIVSLAVAATLAWCMWRTLAPGGWSLPKAIVQIGFSLAVLWVGFCFAQGSLGFAALLFRRPRQPPFPIPVGRMVIGVTVRNEDMASVLPPIRRLVDGLDARGAGARIGVFVLSDSTPDHEAAERAAVAAFGDPDRVRYRRRADNALFKAGNILDFMDRHAEGFDYLLILDADSDMSADAVLRLTTEMESDDRLAIVQHLTVGLPASSAFPRLFQFGMRAGMRTWAVALAWWQQDEACYWGHNALIRIAPFRDHARLPLLPDGRPILSHDQVEAALVAGAGWSVRLLPEEDGSFEANPPALPEFMRRELRWLAGNLEYRHLLKMPGLRPMGRWQLIQAILLFGCTPFYVAILLAAAWLAATDRTSAFPADWALATMVGWAGAIYAPKLLGYLELFMFPAERRRYGGGWNVLIGVLAETLFTLLLDAISVISKTGTTVRLLFGMRPAWTPQNRTDRGVSWLEATRLLWVHTAIGALSFAGFAMAGWHTVVWALPLAGGLLVAIPFCVLTSRPWFGRWLRDRQICAIPEEIR